MVRLWRVELSVKTPLFQVQLDDTVVASRMPPTSGRVSTELIRSMADVAVLFVDDGSVTVDVRALALVLPTTSRPGRVTPTTLTVVGKVGPCASAIGPSATGPVASSAIASGLCVAWAKAAGPAAMTQLPASAVRTRPRLMEFRISFPSRCREARSRSPVTVRYIRG